MPGSPPAMARKSEGPWFWNTKNTWYVWLEGRQVSLGVKGLDNEKEATKAWHRLMADGPNPKPTPEQKVQSDTPTVRALVDQFLSDAESRLKPATVARYRF